VQRDVDALTPAPGTVPGGWLAVYIAAWGLVYGYVIYEGRDRGQRLLFVVGGLAVLAVSYYLLSKTEPFVYASGGPVYSCGSWSSPTLSADVTNPASYCVIKLDSLFRWSFAVAIGGLAIPLVYEARKIRPSKPTSKDAH
jgi:hypothetical protein